MYASASTWLFNVARQVLQAAQAEEVQTNFISGRETKLTLPAVGAVTLIKSHEISSEERTADVARQSSKILITVRDPRDAVVSLMQAHKYDFEQALDFVEQSARLCFGFAKDRRAQLFEYETKFFEETGTVAAVTRHLGYELPDEAITSIHKALNRAEVEKHISQMPKMPGILVDAKSGDLLDTKSHWHSHHSGRNGAIGKWSNALTAKQAAEIQRRLDFYFEKL